MFSSTTHNLIKTTIERIERLEEERSGLAEDVREILKEAKGNGLDPKILRALIRLRKLTPDERQTFEALVESYESALGASHAA